MEVQKIESHQGRELLLSNEITANVLESFISYLDTSPKTIETYTKALRQMFKYFALNNIKNPQRVDILAYREGLKDSGLKPTTVQNYIMAARIFFQWTAQEGIYPNIADRIKGAKLDKNHKKDYLTAEQVKHIIGSIKQDTEEGLRNYAIFSLMITGGLRTVEVSRADVKDLRILGRNTVLYVQGKGREEKTEYIKVSLPVEKAIRDYLAKREDLGEDSPLFASTSNNSRGKRLTTRSISTIAKKIMKEAGYNSERLTAHSLRHTAVTLALLAGHDITEVQQFARHSSLNTTMIYNHALDRDKNGCSDGISNSIF
ncbi:tyrosine-type recombinase/integrase [Streptococcaceae bacterium ESL0729]|nr:tyrosine-type recombinase/integrase [Streptococcaceae bacterium ESL0729]